MISMVEDLRRRGCDSISSSRSSSSSSSGQWSPVERRMPGCRPSFPLTQIRMVRARRRAAGDGGGRLAAREAAVACRGWIGVGGLDSEVETLEGPSAPAPVTQPHLALKVSPDRGHWVKK